MPAVLTSLVLAGLVLVVAQTAADDVVVLKTGQERLSYALGMDLGNQLRALSVQVDPAIFAGGLADGLAGAKTLLTREESRAAIAALQQEVQRREMERAGMQSAPPARPADAETDPVQPRP